MKRLLERELPPQSVEGEAAALLGAVPPHAAEPGMKQRVRARLLAAPVERRGPGFRLALLLAVLAVGSLAAAAGATWLKAQRELATRAATPHAASPAATPVAPPTPAVVDQVARATTPPTSEAPSVALPPTSETPSVTPSGTGHGAGKAPGELTEANLLFDATRALRHEGNPAHAAELLAQYREKFPRGALAEEALALSIEAATARGDTRATTLAKRYLKLYPQGHFVAKAKRALERDGE